MILIVVIIIVYFLWKAYAEPYASGRLLTPDKVLCEAAPLRPINLLSFVDGNRVHVKWNPTAFTDSYTLLVGNSQNFSLANAIRVITDLPDNRTVMLNFMPGDYYMRVKAINTCGESSDSSENSFQVVDFPSKFRICKKDAPNLCIKVEGLGEAIISNTTNLDPSLYSAFEFSYQSGLIKSITGDFWLNNVVGALLPTIEEVVLVQGVAPTDTWNIDVAIGRITSSNNLVLGAGSEGGGLVYNTDATVISNVNDSRYLWEIQARTF